MLAETSTVGAITLENGPGDITGVRVNPAASFTPGRLINEIFPHAGSVHINGWWQSSHENPETDI